MSNFKIVYPAGATPIDPDEIRQLIPTYISNQSELNKLELANILEAMNWAIGNKQIKNFDYTLCLKLHEKMFSKVWRWAGKIRKTEKNIGVPKEQIITSLQSLFNDVAFWLEHQTYDLDELAVRFHHRLVFIHPFPNGNGRHARLMKDILNQQIGNTPFSWGAKEGSANDAISSIVSDEKDGARNDVRADYINALKQADQKNIKDLLRFVRS